MDKKSLSEQDICTKFIIRCEPCGTERLYCEFEME